MISREWQEFLEAELGAIRASGREKKEIIFLGRQGVKVRVNKNGKMYKALNFCANNYLGLANDASLIKAACLAMKKWGYGLASVRFICGTQKIHRVLEKRIAGFLGTEESVIYTSCFDANSGLFEALMKNEVGQDADGRRMAILSDQLNHASIIDGIRLAQAEKRRYSHSDMADLEKCLRETDCRKLKIIATDGVFSMDGDIAKLREICDLAERYGAIVMVDDSHAVGLLGENGRGTLEYCGVLGRVDLITGTFGKALGGGVGGYIAGPAVVTEIFRQRSRPYLFSNSLLPAACASALKALEIAENYPVLRKKLQKNTLYFRRGIKKLGFEIKGDIHPIVPIMLRDPVLAGKMADCLLEEGILAAAFSYPVVPKGEDRIRVQISAAHKEKELRQALAAFRRAGKKLGVI